MGSRQAEVVSLARAAAECYWILEWKASVLQHLNIYRRFLLHSLMLDAHIKAITQNTSDF